MKSRLLLTVFIAAAIVACSFPRIRPPYLETIPQGNEVSLDQVQKLKLGMTRSQVRFALGSPLLTDVFHANRWDYTYSEAKNGQLQEKWTFSVYFNGDSLTNWEGWVMPVSRRASQVVAINSKTIVHVSASQMPSAPIPASSTASVAASAAAKP